MQTSKKENLIYKYTILLINQSFYTSCHAFLMLYYIYIYIYKRDISNNFWEKCICQMLQKKLRYYMLGKSQKLNKLKK